MLGGRDTSRRGQKLYERCCPWQRGSDGRRSKMTASACDRSYCGSTAGRSHISRLQGSSDTATSVSRIWSIGTGVEVAASGAAGHLSVRQPRFSHFPFSGTKPTTRRICFLRQRRPGQTKGPGAQPLTCRRRPASSAHPAGPASGTTVIVLFKLRQTSTGYIARLSSIAGLRLRETRLAAASLKPARADRNEASHETLSVLRPTH